MEARHPGLKVRLVPSESQDIVAQIKAARGHSPYDAMPNGEPPHLIAMRDEYIVKRDDSTLSNLGNVYPEFLEKTNGYGLPATFSLIGIAYNEEMVSTPPTAPPRRRRGCDGRVRASPSRRTTCTPTWWRSCAGG